MKNIQDMTVKEFRELPYRDSWSKAVICSSIIILPSTLEDGLHESGYRFIDYVACEVNQPICRLSGGSDVLHIDGIDGCGEWSVENGLPNKITPITWSIDCLPKSGLLRLRCRGEIKCTNDLSSFEIFAIRN